MSVRRFLIPALVLACALLAGCRRRPAIPPDVIARVGDRMITLADFKRYLDRNAGTELAQITPEVASAMLDQYIEEVTLSEYAAAHGIQVPADRIAAEVRSDPGSTVVEKRDQMRRQRLVADVSAQIPDPADAEMRAYYEKNLGEFRTGEEVRVRQILVHDEALAGDLLKRLKKGASFEELSVQHSLAPNAKRGGEIGYVTRGELPKMFEDEIFSLRPGEVSGVIRTDASFHIFKVEERRAPGTIDFAAAVPVIRDRLRDDAIRQRIAQLVKQSGSEMTIAVLTKRLPFKYSGGYPRSENE